MQNLINKKTPLLIYILFIITIGSKSMAQTKVADSVGYRIIKANEKIFPKFYREFQYVKLHDSLIKGFVFINQAGVGPAFANPNGSITLNLNFFTNKKPNFDDNRLIVVLYHEIGHLHFYQNTKRKDWNPEDSEKAAFEYSLMKTKELAEKGDCLPLSTGVKFMKIRSESDELKDPHVRALKRMVNEQLYADYKVYLAAKCKL